VSADPALERAAAAALATRYQGLPDGQAVDRGGWSVLSWPRRPQAAWAHRVVALGPVSGASLDTALDGLPGLPVLACVPDGWLDGSELSRRGFDMPVRLVRLLAPAAAIQSAPRDPGWIEMVGPQGGGEVSAVGRAGGGPEEPWWWVAPLGAAGWTQLVAYDGDDPVATGAVHVAGQVGALDGVTAVPGERGRLAGTAVVRRLVQLATERGAERVTVAAEPGTPHHGDLLDVGFAPAYGLGQWSRSDGTRGAGAQAAPGRQT